MQGANDKSESLMRRTVHDGFLPREGHTKKIADVYPQLSAGAKTSRLLKGVANSKLIDSLSSRKNTPGFNAWESAQPSTCPNLIRVKS